MNKIEPKNMFLKERYIVPLYNDTDIGKLQHSIVFFKNGFTILFKSLSICFNLFR